MVYKTTPGGIMDQNYLMHHGIKGQEWGVRRFQNPDGTLTPEGRNRYNQYKKHLGTYVAANRLMEYQRQGADERTAFRMEYDRRKKASDAIWDAVKGNKGNVNLKELHDGYSDFELSPQGLEWFMKKSKQFTDPEHTALTKLLISSGKALNTSIHKGTDAINKYNDSYKR